MQFWNSAETLSLSSVNYCRFAMTGGVNASGNIQSLVNWITTAPYACFYRLCDGCDALLSFPAFPAVTLHRDCYIWALHECGHLTSVGDIYATTYAQDCCREMLVRCPSLVRGPSAILAATLPSGALYATFLGCSSLVKAPVIYATTVVSSALNYTFRACTSLTEVDVSFTSWGSTNEWLTQGVPASGIFRKPSALPEIRGGSWIPNGWTVINKD